MTTLLNRQEVSDLERLHEKIDKALDSIRPYLKADGGDVRVLEVTEDMRVTLELLGSCGDCPMSAMTFKAGIQEAIKKEVPEVVSVEAVNITNA